KGAHFLDGRRIRPLLLPPRPRRNRYIPMRRPEFRGAYGLFQGFALAFADMFWTIFALECSAEKSNYAFIGSG
ncbi:MAG: hypothetical protein RSC51_03945, partial [Oscillospiraceae bacterium]